MRKQLRDLAERARLWVRAAGTAIRAFCAASWMASRGWGARAGAIARAATKGLSPRSWKRARPPAFLLWSFGGLIAVGTLGLLILPGLYMGPPLGVVDALFTATSAVCVTGLIVVDTATYFTFWGQLWILVLIQLGGIGFITLTTAIIGMLGGRVSVRAELSGGFRLDRSPLWRLARDVALFTLIAEAAGAALLFLSWLPRFPADLALWHAVFQSVSAFCNAGFSTFSDSLEGFSRSPVTLFVISSLIILGGIGYPCLREVWLWRRADRSGERRRHLSVHTYAVLVTTGTLLALGTLGYAVFEWDNTLAELPTPFKLFNAWFASVTARTAGFNTIPYDLIGNDAGFLTILLMLIGGSPGSAAGGLKTTTLAVLVALAWSRMRGRRWAQIRGRGVPQETLERTVSLVLLALAVLTVSFFALGALSPGDGTAREHAAFLPLAFETMSAFCTVGLSMGATATLTAGGEVVVILLMFIGRVGLMAFFSALLLRRTKAPNYRLAVEDLQVG